MDDPPHVPSDAPPPSKYDALLARHLVSVPAARLYVGDDLRRAHWSGIEAAFGDLLALVPNESILAFYDDSFFGRGTKGVVVTDRHLLVVQGKERAKVALDALVHVAEKKGVFRLTTFHDGLTAAVEVAVDASAARIAVGRWLRAVVRLHAAQAAGWKAQMQSEKETSVPEKQTLSARQALKRLERMIQRKRLGIDERAWLLRLAEDVRALEAARTKSGPRTEE